MIDCSMKYGEKWTSAAFSFCAKDRAKTSQPWLYPCFNRKYVPDNIQGSYLRVMVDLKRFELSTSRMRKDFVNFFGLFLLLLAVSAGFNFICEPL